ncbi:hypothetical protein TrRE_jg9900 [Triparma retinervis]|uniref:Mitochondrial phosphate carrier protein n=1 Tax=Triparma retinervis TaxID=2557542 RepID=A0A9W7KRR2_9STRA|nr:hypothetical protein TrRE_jg9900 [Triparma retinervis]
MSIYSNLMTNTFAAPKPIATSGKKVYDLEYYLKGAAAGGICCSITHGALTPVDVVKTRIQLDPAKYNTGLVGGFKTIIAEEGAGALLTGLGATCGGYFVQGWFKFGGVEFFKIKAVEALGDEKAWALKTPIYLGSSAMAETIADVFLCPLEAVRIRSVSDPEFCDGLADGFGKILKSEGVGGFYAGFGPILFKQVPYTMAKFAVQGAAADSIYGALNSSPSNPPAIGNLGVSLGSGVIAGVAAAIISHPADTLLSMINKAGAGGDGGTVSRLLNISKEVGIVKLCTNGLLPRCVMIGSLTAGQFGIFDTVMGALGASKFHFHNPADDKK